MAFSPQLEDSIVAERYRIVSLAGFGPTSTVYKAEDISTGKTVALKLVALPASLDPTFISAYRSDLNILRNSHNPALIRVYDSGDDLGRIYVAMEWVPGPTLRERLQREGKLPLDTFRQLIADLSSAVGELHTQHTGHRDIHPGNIMWDGTGRWRLAEFGIDRDQRRTRESEEAPYAAPEQIMGQRSSLATDVYSVGAIAFHSLVGRPPVRSAMSPVRVDAPENVVSRELASVIERSLQLDPVKRYQNIHALKTAIEPDLQPSEAVGRALSEWLTPAAPSPETLTPVFVQIVRGLVRLHDAGQDHGELSPKNIRIAGNDVLLERGNGDAPSASATLLITDAKYTAPELVLARKAPDAGTHVRGDVYVLGFVFYELVVGQNEMKRQFAEAEQAQSGLAWMRWHSDPNSTLSPLAVAAPSCPKGLADIIERMTQKAPEQRIQKLEEVAEALEKLTVGLARTQPYAIASTVTKRKPKRSRRTAVAAAILLIAVAGLAARFALTDRDWAGGVSAMWNAAKARMGISGSTRAAALPEVLQTPTGEMILVSQAGGSFYIDRTEVTNRYFREYCRAAGRVLPLAPGKDSSYFERDDFPAINVDRATAGSFCQASGKRLPTEQEWEQAAGGGGEPAVRWGNWSLVELANLRRDGGQGPAKAGSFAADVSPFGMLDAAGNAREWVSDGQSDPLVGILKGGSFASLPANLSSSTRIPVPLDRTGVDLSDVGFRCAVDTRGGLTLSGAH